MKKIFALIFPVLIAFAGCKHKTEASAEDMPKDKVALSPDQLKTIKLDTVRTAPEETELTLTGKVSFDEDKIAKVFPLVGGNVMKVNVSLGDYVKKGDVLAIIRSGDINDIQNQYDVAVSNLQIAKRDQDVAEELYKTNVNSERELLNAKNDYKKSIAEVNKLKQLLRIYGVNEKEGDAEYKVVSPMDGYIVEKNINENMEIRSDNSSNIFTVSFLKTVWVLADVYESDVSKVQLNDEVEITTVSYPDRIFKGKIQQIGNILDPVSKVLKIRIVLDNSEGLLKPEMFAVVKVHSRKSNKVVVIPTSSLVFENNHFHVMVMVNSKVFQKRDVTILRSLGDKTFIKDGIIPGEMIVVKNSLLVSSANI